MLNNFLFKNLALYEIMWKNVIEPGRSQMIMWHVHYMLDT